MVSVRDIEEILEKEKISEEAKKKLEVVKQDLEAQETTQKAVRRRNRGLSSPVVKKRFKPGTKILHCEVSPAMETLAGEKRWFINGRLHREDGPAVEYPNGTFEYYQNGVRHRLDGPAVLNNEGLYKYYINGKLHREDGPAVISPGGDEDKWFLHGQEVEPFEFKENLRQEFAPIFDAFEKFKDKVRKQSDNKKALLVLNQFLAEINRYVESTIKIKANQDNHNMGDMLEELTKKIGNVSSKSNTSWEDDFAANLKRRLEGIEALGQADDEGAEKRAEIVERAKNYTEKHQVKRVDRGPNEKHHLSPDKAEDAEDEVFNDVVDFEVNSLAEVSNASV